MNARQETWLSMYHAVIAHCDNHPAITAAVPAFATLLAELKAKKAAITSIATKEAQLSSTPATPKEASRISLCNKASEVAAIVFAFATAQKDHKLKEEVRTSFTKLRRLQDELLAPACMNIHKAATNNIAALAPWGITPATLTNFLAIINQYRSAISMPRNTTSLRSAYTAELKKLFTETNQLLKTQLDKVALQFKTTEPNFYNAYITNRIIIDAPTSPTRIKGIITGSSKEPLSDVKIQVMGKEYSTTSDSQGKYSLKIPQPGTYTLHFSKEGFTEKTAENILLKLGKTKRLSITLIPAS